MIEINQNQDKEIIFYSDHTNFFKHENCTADLDSHLDDGLKKRLIHIMKWCSKSQRNFSFDLLVFNPRKDVSVAIRRSYVDQINQHTFKIVLSPLSDFSSSEIASSLSLLDNVKDPVLVTESAPITDIGPRVLYCNKAFEIASGYSSNEIVGQTPRILQGALTENQARDSIRNSLLKWESFRQCITNYSKQGESFVVELSISPVKDESGWWTHFVSFQRNMTSEEKEQNQKIIQSRLASMGELAAAIGHEINNPLTIAMARLEKLKDTHQLQDNPIIESIEKAHFRMMKITQSLRTFSRITSDDEIFCLQSLLQESIDFIFDIYRSEDVKIEYEFLSKDSLNVQGNLTQLQQVILNLMANAKDATEGQDSRLIQIKLKEMDQQAIMTVGDNGKGIPPEIRDKIFDQFFTTKEVGKGTGIGLSISNQIIQNHNGSIEFTSSDKGTLFTIKLPLK